MCLILYSLLLLLFYFLQGLIDEKESIEKILKENEIDIVISAVGGGNILDQLCLIEAIKSVGTVKVPFIYDIYLTIHPF